MPLEGIKAWIDKVNDISIGIKFDYMVNSEIPLEKGSPKLGEYYYIGILLVNFNDEIVFADVRNLARSSSNFKNVIPKDYEGSAGIFYSFDIPSQTTIKSSESSIEDLVCSTVDIKVMKIISFKEYEALKEEFNN